MYSFLHYEPLAVQISSIWMGPLTIVRRQFIIFHYVSFAYFYCNGGQEMLLSSFNFLYSLQLNNISLIAFLLPAIAQRCILFSILPSWLLSWRERDCSSYYSLLILWCVVAGNWIYISSRLHVHNSSYLMSSALPKLHVEVLQGRKVFPSILYEDCGRLPMQHRCLAEVTSNGYLFDGVVVCGFAIYSPCSSKHGNEGIYCCELHCKKRTQ